MKLSDAMVESIQSDTALYNEGKTPSPAIDVSRYIHEDEDFVKVVHKFAASCVFTRQTPEQIICWTLEWALEAMRRYGFPTDLGEMALKVQEGEEGDDD